MQVQSGNERFADVDSFGPVDWIIIHADKGALKAYGEYQLLLLKEMLEKRINNCIKIETPVEQMEYSFIWISVTPAFFLTLSFCSAPTLV